MATLTVTEQHAKLERIFDKLGKKVFFGKRKSDGASIYLSLPSWDCGWYWGFGYLGNRNEHYHLSSYQEKTVVLTDDKGKFHVITEKRNINMWDALKKDYELNPKLTDEKLWVFCDLVSSIYKLKETAEVFGRGGSNYTGKAIVKSLKRPQMSKSINEKILPDLFNELFSLFIKN